ncbi:ribonuclease H-like domain-containing protein [Tanacetum coccineum]|uniref:Ribonuclease H-like domain-containing protein n=1 Tax=Tanacetum coccineum TaxID=301880 RepID=A0ABQ5AZ63_9ASTR
MADLGASINVIPKSMFEHLKLANLKETNILVEMADMTKKVPLGIIENILVKINNFLFSLDFVIIDMLKTSNENMILGRPFLATIHAEIDIFNKEISLRIRDDRIIFDMNKISYEFTTPIEKAYMVNVVNGKDLMDIDSDLFLYESESCEFNRLLTIDPDIFTCDIDNQESYEETIYRCCRSTQGEPKIKKEGETGDLPDIDVKRYLESTNDNERINLTWENLSLNDWMKIRCWELKVYILSTAKPTVSIVQVTTASTNQLVLLGPVTTEEKAQKKNDVKARSMLLMALPNEHLMTFNQHKDAKTLFAAIQTRFGVSTANTQVSPASTQVSTANLSDDTLYAFLSSQPNGSQLIYEDLEQIHEDDIEEMDLKWQLALLSMRTRRGPRNQDSRNRNQDSSRRTVNVEETSSKAMVAIDGAGFDWSYMTDDEVPTNMALMAFSDSEVHNDKTCSKTCLKSFKTLKTQLDDLRIEFNKSEFNLATYKRGLASVEEQLVFYKKNEVIFCEQLAVLKRDISYKDSEISMLKNELEKLKQEKESNQLKIENFDNASKSLDKLIGSQNLTKVERVWEEFQQPEFEGYGPKPSKSVSEDTSNEVRESPDAPLVKKLMSDDKLEKKTVFLTDCKLNCLDQTIKKKPVKEQLSMLNV